MPKPPASTATIATVLGVILGICMRNEQCSSTLIPRFMSLISDSDIEWTLALSSLLAPNLHLMGRRQPIRTGPFKMWLEGDLDAYPDLIQAIQEAITEGGFA